MTLKRFGWLSLSAIYYFILLCFTIAGLGWLWSFFSDLSHGIDSFTTYMDILFMASLGLIAIFVPVYAVLYKYNWIKKPAKIIFWAFFIKILLFSYDLLEFFIFVLLLLVLPLLHLYKNNIKTWLISLNSKRFFSFKNKLEISRQDIILSISALVLIMITNIYYYPYEYWHIIPEIILMATFLLSKPSILKDTTKIIIFIISILLLREVIDFFSWADYRLFPEGVVSITNFFSTISFCIRVITLPLFLLVIIFAANDKKVL